MEFRDRDGKWGQAFTEVLRGEGIETVLCPARAPNCNAYGERFIRSLKSECLDRMVFFGEESLRRALREFVSHYHLEWNHQGVGNELLQKADDTPLGQERVKRRQRLGGLLNVYCRQAV